MLTMATCALLFLNCVLSPIAYVFEKKDAVIVLDGLFDIGYMIINAIRINERKAPIDAIDSFALMLPICSIIDIMSSYAQFSLREKERRGEERAPQRGRSRRRSSTILRLPEQNVGLGATEAPLMKKIYRALQLLLTVSALIFGAFSGYTLARCSAKHIACLDKYSACLWRGAWPRAYYVNGSIFDSMTCGEEHVERIDAWDCSDALGETETSDIAFEKFIRLTDLRLGEVVFPKSLARLVDMQGAAMREKPKYATVRAKSSKA